MSKKLSRTLLILAVVFACWLQFPVGLHVKKAIPGVSATCVEAGLTEGKECMLCGKVLAEQKKIPATGLHVYSNDFDKTCNNCSYLREVDCTFEFANNRVVLRDAVDNHQNWRVTVYKLGDRTVADPTDTTALTAIDGDAKEYWGMTEINNIALMESGNYVLLLEYNEDKSAAIKVPLEITVVDEPKLFIDAENEITVVDNNAANKNHTLTVYNLGNITVSEPRNEEEVKALALEAFTYNGAEEINELMLNKKGNYVLYLRYENAEGVLQTIVQTTIVENSLPDLRVDENNQIVVTCDDESIGNFRMNLYYLGEQTVADIYDQTALADLVGETEVIWGIDRIQKVKLDQPGNYVLHLHYNVESGPKETIALQVTISE